MTQSYLSPKPVLDDIRTLPGPLLRWLLALAVAYAVLFTAELAQMAAVADSAGNPNRVLTFVLALVSSVFNLGAPYLMARLTAAFDDGRPLNLTVAMQGFVVRLLVPGVLALLAINLLILLVAQTLLSLPAAIGAPLQLAFLIAIVYGALRLVCLIPLIAYENVGFVEAVKRTWALTAGKVGRIVVVSLVLLLIITGLALLYFGILALAGLSELPTTDMRNLRPLLAALTPAHIVSMAVFYGVVLALSYLLLPIIIYRILRQEHPVSA